MPGQSPSTFCPQARQKRGLRDDRAPNPTRPGLSRKKYENVLSRVGMDFYNSTKCLIVGTSPTTSMYQLERGREHFRTPRAPGLGCLTKRPGVLSFPRPGPSSVRGREVPAGKPPGSCSCHQKGLTASCARALPHCPPPPSPAHSCLCSQFTSHSTDEKSEAHRGAML